MGRLPGCYPVGMLAYFNQKRCPKAVWVKVVNYGMPRLIITGYHKIPLPGLWLGRMKTNSFGGMMELGGLGTRQAFYYVLDPDHKNKTLV